MFNDKWLYSINDTKLEDKNNILYIGGFELPDKNAAAHRVVTNAKILKQLNYDVVFVGVDKSLGSDVPFLSTKKEYEDFSYYSVKYPVSLMEWLDYLSGIKDILKLVNNKTSAIIAYNYPAIALLRLKGFCKKRGIKLIADCTEWYEAQGSFLFRLIKNLDVYLRMRIIHPKLDGLIVISDYLYNFYIEKNKNIINIPPLVDLSMEKWKCNSTDHDHDRINLIYAGSPGAKKDRLDRIIDLLTQIKDEHNIKVTFKILGLTEIQYLTTFNKQAIPENIKDFLIFKGRLPHNDTLCEIINSDFEIFIRDSSLTNTAGFPTKFVESISCGTPVLSNSSSNITDFLLAGKTGFLLDDSTDDKLKSSLYQALLIKPDEIKDMKLYCKSCEIFDFKNYVKSFRIFFGSVIGEDSV